MQKIVYGGFRLSIDEEGREIAHAYLYLIKNDLHEQPYGLMEDVFVGEGYRGSGIGTKIIEALIQKAKEEKCYKLIGTSRKENKRVHVLYKKIGFQEWGREFRMDILYH